MAKKRGPKPAEDRNTVKDETVRVRASKPEVDDWRAKAEARGLTLSEWIRTLANKAKWSR